MFSAFQLFYQSQLKYTVSNYYFQLHSEPIKHIIYGK